MPPAPGVDLPAQPVPVQKYPRKSVSLPEPTHRLLEHVAVHRGLTMTGTIYALAREELARHENTTSWSPIPPPFAIRPAWGEQGALLCFWTPFHARPALLTRPEAAWLANALYAFAEDKTVPLDFRTAYRDQRVHLQRGAHHVSIFIDADSFAVTREVAREVAAAIDNASPGVLISVTPEVIRQAA